MSEGKEFLTEKELSALISVACSTLRTWRAKKKGPEYVKLNYCVRYPRKNIDAWLQICTKAGVDFSEKELTT